MELFIIATILLIILVLRKLKKPEKFPPGPPKVPFLGSYPGFFKKRSLLENIVDIVKQYGPVCGLYIGRRRVVVIADYNILREVFRKDEASGRPTNEPANENRLGWEFMKGINHGEMPGVLMSGGNYWKEQRRFILRTLRDFGFGKSSMESLITEEMQKLCEKLKVDSKTGPISLNGVMNVSILNALWKILMGERLELDDPKLKEVIQLFDEFFRKTSGNISPQVALLPWPKMAKWPILRNITQHSTRQKAYKAINRFIEPYITDHEETLDPNNIRDFTDQMLLEIQSTTDPNSSFYGKKGFYSLFNNIIDLFVAGSETTSSSLLWLFLYLIHHPDVQSKIHAELDQFVGQDRSPCLNDKSKLHYLNAVLYESLRATCLAGAGVPHYTSGDIKVGDYVIPRGTIVFGSLYHIMHNEDFFKDPHTFNPERFLDQDGKFVNNEHAVIFGVGKRFCLGQALAEKEFFLFAAGILHEFRIEAAPGHKVPSYFFEDGYPTGTIRTVPNFRVNLRPRWG